MNTLLASTIMLSCLNGYIHILYDGLASCPRRILSYVHCMLGRVQLPQDPEMDAAVTKKVDDIFTFCFHQQMLTLIEVLLKFQ